MLLEFCYKKVSMKPECWLCTELHCVSGLGWNTLCLKKCATLLWW